MFANCVLLRLSRGLGPGLIIRLVHYAAASRSSNRKWLAEREARGSRWRFDVSPIMKRIVCNLLRERRFQSVGVMAAHVGEKSQLPEDRSVKFRSSEARMG